MVGGQGAAWRVTRREGGEGDLRPIIAHSTLDHCSCQPGPRVKNQNGGPKIWTCFV